MIVDTLGPDGPWCPVCHGPVDREGFFCSLSCWQHFHTVVFDAGEIISMNYLDITEQPWYSEEL